MDVAGILGGIIVEVIIALISLGMGAAGVLFVGKRHGGSHADALPPRINLVENNYGRIYVERDPVAPPSRVGSGTPIRAHADVSTGAGTVQAGPWSKPEMVARLDTAAHTAHIGTTRGEMVLPLGPEPRAHEPMLQAVLEWLIEKDLLAALPNTTPPPPRYWVGFVMVNWPNRSLFVADNIRILRGMNSGSVDCIATDPPFNAKRTFNRRKGRRAWGLFLNKERELQPHPSR